MLSNALMSVHRGHRFVGVCCDHVRMGSHCIELRSADRKDVLSYIGATSLTEGQLRRLRIMKERAVASQD